MDKTQAVALIETLFDKSFAEDTFVLFCTNLLNDFSTAKATPVQSGTYVYEPYRNHIKSFKRVGQYTDPRGEILDVLAVKVNEGYKLERTRTGLRNFAIEYLKRKDDRDTLLIAFFSDDCPDWRLSLVKLEYKTSKDEKGRIKARQEATSARRYSFLVGENEPCHTAKRQLLPLLLQSDTNPTLADLEHCFTIEKVTIEFFEQYKALFVDLQEQLDAVIKKDKKISADFDAKKIESAAFAKKLLGQIVFLYFIQKKGWLGVPKEKSFGFGDKRFLKSLFKQAQDAKANYYNGYLEFLFYEALAAQRTSADPSYYKKFNCRIPFLNGGLFEPIKDYDWQNTEINLPNEIFHNTKPTKENDVGTGILDVFDRYNFTVKEDEPLDKEVAVDPEMLGKVFENLLEVKDRKSKGAFYTPREIVHYMCQESLINYLDTTLNSSTASYQQLGENQTDLLGNTARKQTTLEFENKETQIPKTDIDAFIKNSHLVVEDNRKHDNSYTWKLPEAIKRHAKLLDTALAEIKVCDPAIGSGAFPVGMLNEIVKARTALTLYMKLKDDDDGRTQYHLKRECIQNSLYGVDIDESAIDIAKLRLWLSLVVDEDSIQDIEPLPNLDYKIVCGNSLLGIEIDAFNVGYFEELEEKKKNYFSITDPKGKRGLHKEIDEIIYKITNGKKAFDFEIYFSEVWHRPSDEINVVNTQIGALNKQIEAINGALKLGAENEITKLKFVVAYQQVGIIEIEIKKIEKNIENLFGQVTTVDKYVLKEQKDLRYEISALNHSIELINKKICELNARLSLNVGKGGFDVVIGNPPYGAELDKTDIEAIEKRLQNTNNLNSAAIFIDFAKNRLVNCNGIVSFIVPKSLLYSEKWFTLASALSKSTNVLVDVEKAFEKVKLEQVVFVFNKSVLAHSYTARKFVDADFIRSISLNVNCLSKFKAWICDVTKKEIEIAEKVLENSIKLETISNTKRGAGLQKFLSDNGKYSLIGGINIARYNIDGTKGFVSADNVENSKNKFSFMLQPKIISQDLIAHIQNPKPHIKIMSYFDKSGKTLGLDTVQNTVLFSRDYSYQSVVAILNSSFASWYTYRFIYCSAVRTMHFDNHYIGRIPISKSAVHNKKSFVILVDTIQKRYSVNIDAEIDARVAYLYSLTESEYQLILEGTEDTFRHAALNYFRDIQKGLLK